MLSDTFLSPAVLYRKKMLILICGIMIFFLTSMAKVLVPATIFNDLLKLGMPVNLVSLLGAAFLYSYAASQLLMGCFSDRYGGVRILLVGGGVFSLGTILFPLLNNFWPMLLCRIFAGFGAGTCFLGVAKLLNDLFERKFSMMLGAVLFFGYLGPTAGTVPVVSLVETAGWRVAMIIPGIIASGFLLLILLFMRGTIAPVTRGQTMAPLLVIVRNKYLWCVSAASATVFGSYYSITGQIGQKIFSDIFHFAADRAAVYIMILTLIVAVNNLLVNPLLKLSGNRRKVIIVTGVAVSLAGAVLGECSLGCGWGWQFFLLSLVLAALPAGLFSIFSTVAKELTQSEYTVVAIAFINFMAFVFMSLYQNIVGMLLKLFVPTAGTLAFQVEAYMGVYWFFIVGGIFSLISALLIPETANR